MAKKVDGLDKKASKSQAALEFMMSYGWVIIVVVLAIIALSYFGVLNPDRFAPSKCILEAGIGCSDFKIQEDSITFVLRNSRGEDITISDISVESCSGSGTAPLKNGEQAQIVVYGCDNEVAERFSGEVKLTYTGETELVHNVIGTVEGIVSEGVEEEQGGDDGEEEGGLDLPQGAQRYFLRSNPASPQIIEAIIDPLDVHVGDTQTMTVTARDTEATVTSVTAAIETDTGIKNEDLSLIQELSSGRTVWQGSWVVVDTHSATYRTTFTATNDIGESRSATLTWTDPCAPPSGGTWVLDDNCGITGVQGVSDGDFKVETYTITINADATFVWPPGQSINISSGSLAIANGGQLKQTRIWMYDSDGDGYGKNTTMYFADTAPEAGYVERSTMTSYTSTDANDGSGTVWQTLSCYVDGDNDGYTTGNSVSVDKGSACNSPVGHQASQTQTDCVDNNAAINPGSGVTCNYDASCGVPDDAACGTISCSGWYAQSGTESATATETCYNKASITTSRCEAYNDCKDANTADCSGQANSASQYTCGTCKYIAASACTSGTLGSCTNYASGTDSGTCRECNGAGAEQAPADDSACGTISCASRYVQSGTESATATETCKDRADITSSRCEGLGDCKDANTADCDSQSGDTTKYTCGNCKFIAASACTGGTLGACSNYDSETLCTAGSICDGSGNCVACSGRILKATHWDSSTVTGCVDENVRTLFGPVSLGCGDNQEPCGSCEVRDRGDADLSYRAVIHTACAGNDPETFVNGAWFSGGQTSTAGDECGKAVTCKPA